MLDLAAIFQSVDQLPYRTFEKHSRPGGSIRGRRCEATSTGMIDTPFSKHRGPAYGTKGRSYGGTPGKAGRADVKFSGIRHESLAAMAEGREKKIGRASCRERV